LRVLKAPPGGLACNSGSICHESGGEPFVSRPEPIITMPEPIELEGDRTPAPHFLVVDPRVPEPVRQLLEEADGCLNMAFSVGGSACARRAIWKTFEVEGVHEEEGEVLGS
jgi:hypothetical protein